MCNLRPTHGNRWAIGALSWPEDRLWDLDFEVGIWNLGFGFWGLGGITHRSLQDSDISTAWLDYMSGQITNLCSGSLYVFKLVF